MVQGFALIAAILLQATAVTGEMSRAVPGLPKRGLTPEMVVVAGDATGLLDRTGGATLQVPADALALARTDSERTALIAIILSYKVGRPAKRGPSKLASFVTEMVGASVEEIVAARDRSNPDLELPTTPRRWGPVGEPYQKPVDTLGVRALAWARAEGVCEATTVAFLNRLIAVRVEHSAISADAQRIRDGLGMIGFNPETHCRP